MPGRVRRQDRSLGSHDVRFLSKLKFPGWIRRMLIMADVVVEPELEAMVAELLRDVDNSGRQIADIAVIAGVVLPGSGNSWHSPTAVSRA